MSTQVQLKRGTTLQNNTYTGAIGEITVDTIQKQLRLHDGVTAGGTIIGGQSSTSTNIAGGVLGAILYQTAPGVTGFINPGVTGSFLISNGTTATYSNTVTSLVVSSNTNATSTVTGALQVVGGVGIGGSLYVGNTSTFNGLLTVNQTVAGNKGMIVTGSIPNNGVSIRATNIDTATNSFALLTAESGFGTPAMVSITANGFAAQTAIEVTSSDFYVRGASSNKDIYIATNFNQNAVKISGTDKSMILYSTVSAISTSSGALTVAGGVGIGGDLWVGGTIFMAGAGLDKLSSTTGTFVNVAVTGTGVALTVTNNMFIGGTLQVVGQSTLAGVTATAFTATGITVNGTGNATSTITGALQVIGGVGVGGNIYAGGMFSANSAVLTTATTSTLVVSSANNLNGGTAGAVSYQSAPGATTFLSIGTNGYVLQSNGSTPVWAALSGLTSGLATTATNLAGGLLGYIPYQTSAGVTAFITTGSQGTILQMGANTATFATTGSIQVGYAANLLGGTPGQIHYQSAANTTQFLSTGSQGQILVSQPGAPVFTSTTTIQVGYAGTATNIAGGTTGQVPFQSGNPTTPTLFFGPGTTGQLLVSAGASAGGPVFTNTSTVQVGFSANTLGGTAGQIVYQTSPNTTGFVATATTGYYLQANYVGSPNWTSSSTMQVGYSANVLGGTPGQLHYQSSANTTGFISTGTQGQILVSQPGAPVYTNTSSIQVGYAANLLGGAGGSLHYQSAANTTAMLSANTQVGAVLASNGSTPVYVTQVQASSTGTASANQATGQTLVVTAGGIGVTGNSYFANQLTVASSLSSTASIASNALYVAGGIGVANDLTVGRNAVISGNLTVNGQITGTNVGIVVSQVTATSGVFLGDATGNGALYAGVANYTPFGQTMFQASGNYNDYMEINVQNINSGAKASTDIVASADNVTLANSFINMGITSSQWDGTQAFSLGTALSPNDGYIMIGKNATPGNGDLVFGTTTTGTNFKFLAEVTSSTVTPAMIAVTINKWNTPTSSTASGTLVVQGGVGFSGGVYIGGLVTATSIVNITNATSATSTTTGALQVLGGVGIQGSLWAGNIYTNGAQILPTSIQTFTATSGQTTFTVAGGYTVGQIQVIVNGISFSSVAGDFTASNGTTVVLSAGRNTGDIVQVIASQGYAVSAQQAYSFNQYTSNGTTTTFTTNYNTATVQVFQNGILQMPTTYTANNGTSIVFGSIPANGVVVGVVSFNSVSITNAISSSGGTINGTLNVSGSLQQNGVDITTLATALSIAMGL